MLIYSTLFSDHDTWDKVKVYFLRVSVVGSNAGWRVKTYPGLDLFRFPSSACLVQTLALFPSLWIKLLICAQLKVLT